MLPIFETITLAEKIRFHLDKGKLECVGLSLGKFLVDKVKKFIEDRLASKICFKEVLDLKPGTNINSQIDNFDLI